MVIVLLAPLVPPKEAHLVNEQRMKKLPELCPMRSLNVPTSPAKDRSSYVHRATPSTP